MPTYDLSALPLDQKTSICTKNTAFCLNTCLQQVQVNTCDPITMQFQCSCSSGPLPVDIHYFPIQAQQCVGETQDCRNGCAISAGSNSGQLQTCSNNCDVYFACGTAAAKEKMIFYPSNSATTATVPSATVSNVLSTTTPLHTSGVQGVEVSLVGIFVMFFILCRTLV